MKVLIYSVFTTCFLLKSIVLFAQKKAYKVQAIAFYNVENLFHPSDEPGKFDDDFTPFGAYRYTEDVYKKKLKNMAFAISKIAIDKIPQGPAIIGLAEVENAKVLQDLVSQSEIKDRNFRFIHFDSPDARGIDVALLYNPNYFKLISAQAIPVLLSENGKKLHTRDVLYVVGLLEKDTMHVLVNHWTSRYGGSNNSEWKRKKAAAVNRSIIDSILEINAQSKILVMGDFNDNPDDSCIVEDLATSDTKSDLIFGELYNPFMAFYRKGLGTSVYKNNWNLFDQIIISNGLVGAREDSWQFYKAEIFNKPFLINPFGKNKGQPHRSYIGTRWIDGFSDHFPVLIYLIK